MRSMSQKMRRCPVLLNWVSYLGMTIELLPSDHPHNKKTPPFNTMPLTAISHMNEAYLNPDKNVKGN